MNPKPISTIIIVTVFYAAMNFFSSRRRSVFGSNLGESWAAFPNIPQVVIACAEVIDAHGDTEGLFSTPGCRGIALKGERTLCVHTCVCVWWDEACARSRPIHGAVLRRRRARG